MPDRIDRPIPDGTYGTTTFTGCTISATEEEWRHVDDAAAKRRAAVSHLLNLGDTASTRDALRTLGVTEPEIANAVVTETSWWRQFWTALAGRAGGR